ncbi:MAG: diguanylate cyclase domain-containing protein [Betaproteobacteria bacterium]
MTRISPSLHQQQESSIGARVHLECLHHLVGTAAIAAWVTLAGSAMVVAWLYAQAPTMSLVYWFLAMAGLSLMRLVYKHVFDRRFEVAKIEKWESAYALILGFTGLAWGLLAWLPVPGYEYPIFFCIAVILVISASTLIASRKTFFSFGVGVLLPLAVAQLARDDALGLFLGLGTLAISVVILLAYQVHYRILVGAIANQHRSEELLQQHQVILESAAEGIAFIKPKPEYTVECNRRFAEMLGYSLEALKGMEPARWHPDRPRWRVLVEESSPVIACGQSFEQVMQLRRADGSLFWANATGRAVDALDLRAGTVWVISDITEKRATEAALRLSERRFRELVKISSDIYWEQDAEFRFTKFDGKDEILERIPLSEYMGRTRWGLRILSEMSVQEWEEHRALLERHEPFRDLVYPFTTPSGQKRWMTVSGNPLFDEEGRFIGYHGVSSDITSRVQSEERYRHLAFHDTLTQLPNRRLLEDRVERAIVAAARNNQQCALLLLDLDGFKQINDIHGHGAGDVVLKTVAARLRTVVRDTDTVARLGGDEFVVLLREITDIDVALRVAEKIRDAIAEPLRIDSREIGLSASIGISTYPQHGATISALLECADKAMYRSKRRGERATHIYSAD